MKAAIKRILRKTRALDIVSRLTGKDRVEILLYHGLRSGSTDDPKLSRLMPVEQFEEQVRIFARYSRPLRLEELSGRPRSGIILTFDDGYASNYHLAFPILQKYQFPATVFVATGFVDRAVPLWPDWLDFLIGSARGRAGVFEDGGKRFALRVESSADAIRTGRELRRYLSSLPVDAIHEFLRNLESYLQARYGWDAIPAELHPLSWHQIRAMRDSGIVSFGSHTVSHPVLSRCTEQAQRTELVESKQRLEAELGQECLAFAYPFGKHSDYTNSTRQIVRECGYKIAVTTEPGCNRPSAWDVYELNRWGTDISSDDLSFVVSGGPVITQHLGHLFQHA